MPMVAATWRLAVIAIISFISMSYQNIIKFIEHCSPSREAWYRQILMGYVKPSASLMHRHELRRYSVYCLAVTHAWWSRSGLRFKARPRIKCCRIFCAGGKPLFEIISYLSLRLWERFKYWIFTEAHFSLSYKEIIYGQLLHDEIKWRFNYTCRRYVSRWRYKHWAKVNESQFITPSSAVFASSQPPEEMVSESEREQ